jgi:hypothetical membrane protein
LLQHVFKHKQINSQIEKGFVVNFDNAWGFRLCGACGIVAPIIALTCILLAINYAPQFSWTDSALSDLGVAKGIAAPLFNHGLVAGGVVALVFTAGLFRYLSNKTLDKAGTFFLALTALALVSIGIFPENVKPTHYYVSVAFFVLFPVSMLIHTVAFLLSNKKRMSLFTLFVAITAAAPWILYFTTHFVEGVAIPETVSAVSASAWLIVLGLKMLMYASQSTR